MKSGDNGEWGFMANFTAFIAWYRFDHLHRLRALYEAENEQYIREIGATVETELDRQVCVACLDY